MDILPGVRKKIMRLRTEKILKTSSENAMVFSDVSIEEFIEKKMDNFFKQLGTHETRGLYDVVIKQTEKPMIKKAMDWADGNQIKASRVLGLSRNTLRSKINKLKIK